MVLKGNPNVPFQKEASADRLFYKRRPFLTQDAEAAEGVLGGGLLPGILLPPG